MAFVEEIKGYEVNYYGGGKNTKNYKFKAILGLRGHGDQLLGGAYFHRDASTMPDSDEKNSSDYISLHYEASDFHPVLDLLRNEKPCYLRYIDEWNIASITTAIEPVGEGEETSEDMS